MNRVIHFEIAADDAARASEFYTRVFGWKIQKWDNPEHTYWLVNTGDASAQGINGGITGRMLPQPVVNTVDVTSVDESVATITANGGSVVAPKMEIPGVGYLAYCKDTEGNIFGIMQPFQSA